MLGLMFIINALTAITVRMGANNFKHEESTLLVDYDLNMYDEEES